ncbi:MAG TPA: YdeI/OmpD-associated family protein [Devosiaceae bacterium]|nr:YdeI/OmpD-associated family protein [Devosiaceae bacterium]
MAPVTPNPAHIRDFPDATEFEKWLAANHAGARELWLKIHKNGSGRPTVSYAEAVEVALCWGWIDGQRKAFDEHSFLQRFTPRGTKSIWSQRNVEQIERLMQAGRMTGHGQLHVDAAKADGRWQAAYAPGSEMEVPEDLLAAIAGNPAAQKTFDTLNRQNRFALAFRTNSLKTAAGRQKKIAGFVEMLARGDTLHPNGRGAKP